MVLRLADEMVAWMEDVLVGEMVEQMEIVWAARTVRQRAAWMVAMLDSWGSKMAGKLVGAKDEMRAAWLDWMDCSLVD